MKKLGDIAGQDEHGDAIVSGHLLDQLFELAHPGERHEVSGGAAKLATAI